MNPNMFVMQRKLFLIRNCGRVHDRHKTNDIIVVSTSDLLLKDLGIFNNSKHAAFTVFQTVIQTSYINSWISIN